MLVNLASSYSHLLIEDFLLQKCDISVDFLIRKRYNIARVKILKRKKRGFLCRLKRESYQSR